MTFFILENQQMMQSFIEGYITGDRISNDFPQWSKYTLQYSKAALCCKAALWWTIKTPINTNVYTPKPVTEALLCLATFVSLL